jgi:hypothetical protein
MKSTSEIIHLWVFIIPSLVASGVFMVVFVVADNVAMKFKAVIWVYFLIALLVTVNGLEKLACHLFEVKSCKWLGCLALLPHLIFGVSYKWNRSFRRRVQRAFNYKFEEKMERID